MYLPWSVELPYSGKGDMLCTVLYQSREIHSVNEWILVSPFFLLSIPMTTVLCILIYMLPLSLNICGLLKVEKAINAYDYKRRNAVHIAFQMPHTNLHFTRLYCPLNK